MKQLCLGVGVAIGLTLSAFALDGTSSPANVAPLFQPAPLDLPPDLMAQASLMDLLKELKPIVVEEIYILRSVREVTPTDAPTEFCAKARTGVERAELEWQYTFRSVGTSTLDGSVLDANAKTIGSAHACFGPTANPAIFEFYADIFLESTRPAKRIAFKGFGECQLEKPDFPEKGLTISRCFLDLSGLPVEYVGGRLTPTAWLPKSVRNGNGPTRLHPIINCHNPTVEEARCSLSGGTDNADASAAIAIRPPATDSRDREGRAME